MFALFLLTCAISFLGSIQPSGVSIALVQTTLTQGWRAALLLALGGCLPEVLYGGLAAGGLTWLSPKHVWPTWLTYLPVLVLLIIGIATLCQRPIDTTVPATTGGTLSFGRGLLLSLISPQLLTFWSAVWLSLPHETVQVAGAPWVFALGAATGAFVLLMGYAWLATHYRQRLLHYLTKRWLNWLSGGFLIAMACWRLRGIMYNV